MSSRGADQQVRSRLEARLQLEEELAGREAMDLDARFSAEKWTAFTDPMRHLIDTLHLPMRGNEQMNHIMKLKLAERKGGKKKSPGPSGLTRPIPDRPQIDPPFGRSENVG